MNLRLFLFASFALLATACGNKIGDSCGSSLDCAADNSRTCDLQSLPDGYCTIEGCDFDTCPDEAVCVRFFPGAQTNRPCTGNADCGLDELCTLGNFCVPRILERRFCMLKCGGNGDCRDGYECRDTELMKKHGGEPVPDPADATSTIPDTGFCATRQLCITNEDCEATETCDLDSRTCAPL
jgi:hypothetical protein